MEKRNANDLLAFLAVARDRSFTKAANKLGVTTSALSRTMRSLEERIGVRLLTRTTRAVAPTEAGELLLESLGPLFDEIETKLDSLSMLRDTPAGTVRLTCTDHVSHYILREKIAGLVTKYPDIKVEIVLDYGLTNIVDSRIDAGIRVGESVSKDMIAVPLGPGWRFSLVGTPSYFARNNVPKSPYDLTKHNCAKLRLTTGGGVWAWDFKDGHKEFTVRVDGQLTYNSIMPCFYAALDGLCLAYVPEDLSRPYIENGELQEVLQEWSLSDQVLYLYYPSRRQPTPAFSALLEAIRYRP